MLLVISSNSALTINNTIGMEYNDQILWSEHQITLIATVYLHLLVRVIKL